MLVEVRAGHLVIDRGQKTHQTSKAKTSTGIEMVEGSTNRTMAQRSYELESRILSEASIMTIKGDDLDCSEE